jgi:hypothetical protein
MSGAPGVALVRIAALRSRIAVLARGGEYELASRLLREHAAKDLGLGLTADTLRRAHQAAAVAEHLADSTASSESLLVLGLSLIQAGDAASAGRAAEVAAARAANATERDQPRLLLGADLVLGIAERVRGHTASARAALDRARQRAAGVSRPDLTAAVLVELGLLDLAENATDAAATCFWFARDFYRIARRGEAAARTAMLPLVVYAAAERWSEVVLLAPAIADDAATHELAEVGARVRGLEADALAAQGSPRALAIAHAASDQASALPDGAARRELMLRARLRLVRLSTEPDERLHHLEAAFDLGIAARDVAVLAQLAETLLAELAAGQMPSRAADVLGELSTELRRLGAFELADLAAAARAELE